MRITRLQPQVSQQPRFKCNTVSNSHQKLKHKVSKKKYLPTLDEDLNPFSRHKRLAQICEPNTILHTKVQSLLEPQSAAGNNGNTSTSTSTRIPNPAPVFVQKNQRENFIEYVQAQLRLEQRQRCAQKLSQKAASILVKQNGRNSSLSGNSKLKLPLIGGLRNSTNNSSSNNQELSSTEPEVATAQEKGKHVDHSNGNSSSTDKLSSGKLKSDTSGVQAQGRRQDSCYQVVRISEVAVDDAYESKDTADIAVTSNATVTNNRSVPSSSSFHAKATSTVKSGNKDTLSNNRFCMKIKSVTPIQKTTTTNAVNTSSNRIANQQQNQKNNKDHIIQKLEGDDQKAQDQQQQNQSQLQPQQTALNSASRQQRKQQQLQQSLYNKRNSSKGIVTAIKQAINNQGKESPLKHHSTGGDKKRSQINSVDKVSNTTTYPNRQKRTFSINQSKKRYAVSYMDFCLFMSILNGIKHAAVSPSSVVTYRAFVGKGNNSILIRNTIKKRFWWNISPEANEADVNLLWLQNRGIEFINQLAQGPQLIQKCQSSIASTTSQSSSSLCKEKQSLSSQNQNCFSVVSVQEQTLGTQEKALIADKKITQATKKQRFHLQNKGDEKSSGGSQQIKEFTKSGFWKLMSEKQIKQSSQSPFFADLTTSNTSASSQIEPSSKLKIHNHLEYNWNLTNKKALFYNLRNYYSLVNDDPFKYIPLTFHVKEYGDESWQQFASTYETLIKQFEGLKNANSNSKKKKKKDQLRMPLWIVKPGQNSNQGCGIQVSDSIDQIKDMVKTKAENGRKRSSIIQKYLMPFLYNKRKFDIRVYMLVTSFKGVVKGYWYEQGYIRTSCKQFTLKNLKNRLIHLTNDAVQKKSEDYGKHQNGNKVSFADFQKYLDNTCPDKKLNFFKSVYPAMMNLSRDTLNATYPLLDVKNREFTFQIFGLDYMIDDQFNTWLIEVNNNPCLQLSSPLLARIIPNMIENAFKLCLDPLFPPPSMIPKTKFTPTDLFQSNKFTLIFNSADIEQEKRITKNQIKLEGIIIEDDEEENQEQLQQNQDEQTEEQQGTNNMLSDGNNLSAKKKQSSQPLRELGCGDTKSKQSAQQEQQINIKAIHTVTNDNKD